MLGDGGCDLRAARLYVCGWPRRRLGVIVRAIIGAFGFVVAVARYPWRTLLLASAVTSLAVGLGLSGWLFGATDIAKARLWTQFRATLYAHHGIRSSLSHYT